MHLGEKDPTGRQLSIEGFPNATQVVAVAGPLAERASHLALHASDVRFAKEIIATLANGSPVSDVTGEALWRTAIVQFTKCFKGSNARSRLEPRPIFGAGESQSSQNFRWFMDLRDKHIAHDDNSYSQAQTVALLNDGTKDIKVEAILNLTQRFSVLSQANIDNLRELVDKTLAWVLAEVGGVRNQIQSELEARSYAELSALSPSSFTAPGFKVMSQTRR
jgi:hypothetical protein